MCANVVDETVNAFEFGLERFGEIQIEALCRVLGMDLKQYYKHGVRDWVCPDAMSN